MEHGEGGGCEIHGHTWRKDDEKEASRKRAGKRDGEESSATKKRRKEGKGERESRGRKRKKIHNDVTTAAEESKGDEIERVARHALRWLTAAIALIL